MNFYKPNNIRFEDEEETPKDLPENPMEKMMSGWQFDKKFIEQRKVFLWGVVDDKSAKDILQITKYIERCPKNNGKYHACENTDTTKSWDTFFMASPFIRFVCQHFHFSYMNDRRNDQVG